MAAFLTRMDTKFHECLKGILVTLPSTREIPRKPTERFFESLNMSLDDHYHNMPASYNKQALNQINL
jgi:hypothetical protein